MIDSDLKLNAIVYLQELAQNQYEFIVNNIDKSVKTLKKSPAQARLDIKEAENDLNTFVKKLSNDSELDDLLRKELPLPLYVRTLTNPSLKQIFDFNMPQKSEILNEENSYKDWVKQSFHYEYDEKLGREVLASPHNVPKIGDF